MDPREARFLASQAERLACCNNINNNNKKQQQHPATDDRHAPELVSDDKTNDNVVGGRGGSSSKKDGSDQFFTSFRNICIDFRSRLDELMSFPSSSSLECPTIDDDDDEDAPRPHLLVDISNRDDDDDDDARAYYATASRRNEGRMKLDAILQDVRSLQCHALSSSSSLPSFIAASVNRDHNRDDDDVNNDDDGKKNELLHSILRYPMLEITRTDMRLITNEMDDILKRIDDIGTIICPKERFVFKRYRRAMEEMEAGGSGGSGTTNGGTRITQTGGGAVDNAVEANDESIADDHEDENDDRRRDVVPSTNHHVGGVLENVSNCTVEISSDGTIIVDKIDLDMLRYYAGPRPLRALHPPLSDVDDDDDRVRGGGGEERRRHATVKEEGGMEGSSSYSYLLRNLHDVVVVVHGSRPSLHLQHIRNSKIYVSEPTLGAVHVTDCHSSTVRCSCYQLRVHDSISVEFDVWTRSGPIIEDCTGMEFSGNYYSSDEWKGKKGDIDGVNRAGDGTDGAVVGRNMFWDVKDFNWLRALRKSPNFVVVTTSTANVDVVEEPLSNTPGILPIEEYANPTSSAMEGEDSEDEL